METDKLNLEELKLKKCGLGGYKMYIKLINEIHPPELDEAMRTHSSILINGKMVDIYPKNIQMLAISEYEIPQIFPEWEEIKKRIQRHQNKSIFEWAKKFFDAVKDDLDKCHKELGIR